MSINKLILPDSYGFDHPTAALVGYHSRGIDTDLFTKRASASIVEQFSGFKPPKGHSHIHLIAMGASDAYSNNRNGDGFYKSARKFDIPEGDWQKVRLANGGVHIKSASTYTDRTETGLLDRYKTFEKFADVYKHHKNKKAKGDKVYGSVKAAAYNEPMERVELLIEVPDNEWESELEKLASGDSVPFSMSATVPYDICSVCGHKATSRDEYCEHADNQLTTMLKSGHIVHVINERPTFFDISRVNRPADRIAWSLTKAAGLHDDTTVLDIRSPSIEALMSSHPGRVARRLEILKKAAEIEKEIPVNATLKSIRRAAPNRDKANLKKLESLAGKYEKAASLFGALNSKSVCLHLEDFVNTIVGKEAMEKLATDIAGAKLLLPTIYTALLDDPIEVAANTVYDGDRGYISADPYMTKVAEDLSPEYSLELKDCSRRLACVSITGNSTSTSSEFSKSASEVDIDSISNRAASLAAQYASYQLSFIEQATDGLPQSDKDHVITFCVLQNNV